MDKTLIREKIESLHRCVHRIESRCPEDPETLAIDPDLQDILAVNLTRAVQLCADIAAHCIAGLGTPAPHSMGEAFSTLARAGLVSEDLAGRLRRAVGFRNIAVHTYRAIDWGIVHTIATTRLDEFREFARVIGARLDSGIPGRM